MWRVPRITCLPDVAFFETILWWPNSVWVGPGRPIANSTDSRRGGALGSANQHPAHQLRCFGPVWSARLALTCAGAGAGCRPSDLRGWSEARPGRGPRGRARHAWESQGVASDRPRRQSVGGVVRTGGPVPDVGFSDVATARRETTSGTAGPGVTYPAGCWWTAGGAPPDR